MSLSKCLKKAGESIAREDKVAILAKAKELRESGLENQAAARKAVSEILGAAKSTLAGMTEKLGLNKPAKPAFSRKEDKPFYSALARGIEGINAKSQPAEGWRAQIQGLVNAGKVKADEVEWSGLGDWLKLKSGKVSKQEVQDFIAANGVQVHEVTKGAGLKLEDVRSQYVQAMVRQGAKPSEADQMFREMRAFSEDAHSYDEALKDKGYELIMRDGSVSGNELHDAVGDGDGNDSKYGQYVLPGGENYREVLLTLPTKPLTSPKLEQLRRDMDALQAHYTEADNERMGDLSDAIHAEREKLRTADQATWYKSSHWDESNVLSHIRLNDRTNAEGKKVLFVEELQSDWAQAGRKVGFVGDKLAHDSLPDGYAVRTRKEDGDANITRYWVEDPSGRRVSSDHYNRDSAVNSVINDLNDRARGTNASPVPRAPFVDSTDKWLPLALKRVMKLAADGGYDKVAFVNGTQSSERYDLSKQISRVTYSDARVLRAYDHDGKNVINKRLESDEELPDLVGKDVAQRLIEAPKKDIRIDGVDFKARELSGLDLKVGGEGMKAFYDAVVPQSLSKLLPKFGGGKLEPVTIGGTPRFTVEETPHGYEVHKDGKSYSDDWAGALKDTRAAAEKIAREMNASESGTGLSQSGFSVTDAMREKTAGGVPMFSRKDKPEEPAKPATPNPSHGFHTREIQVDGKWRPIEDSSGRILARGDFRGQQNFYKFFGDSAVIDQRGRPQVVYHGTDASDPINKFGGESYAGWFAEDPKRADAYTSASMDDHAEDGAIYPTYLSIKKPLDLSAIDANDKFDAEKLAAAMKVPAEEVQNLFDEVATGDQYWNLIDTPSFREWVQGLGNDGVKLTEGGVQTWAALKPEQIKSALGNRGTFSDSDPDIRFARKGTTAATANLPASAPLGTWERSKSVVSDLIDEGLTKSGVYKFTSPMSEGSVRAKAIAQNFANAERQARREWQRVQDVIAKDFPDKTVREKMWNAADEENEILSGRLAPSPSVGLASLTPRQRDVVEQLHAYGEELLQRAKDVGMFSGDGVPYWTPRMMVMLDANGEYTRPVEPGKKQTSGGDGKNVFTSSSNLKQRKYLTSAETEAAMNAKGGELVRDITTMPMAMQRLERAIAGRELINQVKDLGRATGTATVSNSMHEGFFTLDHPSFTRFQPRFEKDPATGKSVAMQDSHGNIILDRVPLYMSKEFEGPIKAILSNTDGTAYRAYMLLKSKAMSAIMFSPAIHQMVIFGRALGYDPTLVGTVGLYFRGNAAKKDDALVREAIEGGLVPMGGNHAGMIDITDVARGIGREGGLGDPNESWIAHGAKFIVGAVNKDAGAAAKRFIDKAGEYWHGTLLWDRVGDLQMGIFAHAYERLQSEGFDPKVAAVMAAHWGNRYAGAVGRENMGEYARKAANVLLFSRSFNAGNWGTIKDMAYGMPAGLRAKIEFEHGKGAAGQAYTEARRKAIAGFIADAALSLIALSLAQSAVDKLKKDKGWDEIFGGYMDRAGRMAEEVKRHPFTPKSYSPWQLSPTHDNEPHKEDRVDMGEIPGAGGRHEYMRLPTGKVVEDLINWTSHPAETFSAKMSPLAKAAWQIVSNDKGFGVPVYDPDGSMAGFGMDVAKHLAKAQTPWDTIVTAWDKMQGKTTQIENAKLLGNMTGFSASQGHPQGPEAGVAAEVEERIKAQKLMAMEEVKRLLKYDKEDQAREKLEAVGLTPREVNQVIKKIENPKEMTPSQRRKFNSHSTDEDQQRMERVTR